METKNELIYRKIIEKILLEMEYGAHFSLPETFTKSIAGIINNSGIIIYHYAPSRAIGIGIPEDKKETA